MYFLFILKYYCLIVLHSIFFSLAKPTGKPLTPADFTVKVYVLSND